MSGGSKLPGKENQVMKKVLFSLLILAALLCGCGKEAQPEATQPPVVTTEATEAPTEEETTVPPTTEPAPVYRNPLNGQILEEPYNGRIFAFTIGNTREALPHYGVSKCDLLFETFANGLTTRRFAMYSNVQDVDSIGGSRSMRVQFTDLCQGYDAIGVHAAGSNYVMGDMHKSGIDNIHSEKWDADFFYRDKERMKAGYSREHCLYVRGADIWQYADSQGMRLTQEPDKEYGMLFREDAMPQDGEAAEVITMTFHLSNRNKDTIMTYSPANRAYTMRQYDMDMVDGIYNNQPELYKNVFALFFPYHYESRIYHVPETIGEGDGFFACDGRIIPIKWHRADDYSAFSFTRLDGTPLEQGVGSSYIAMLTLDSPVSWEAEGAMDPVVETAAQETDAEEAARPEETAAAAEDTEKADESDYEKAADADEEAMG